jgi:DNA-binding CsgD family transcriptional regulator
MHDTGSVTASGTLELGRAAMARRSWGEAYQLFAAADADILLEPDDLEQLALAAYLTGHSDASTKAWTRAHHDALRRNDPRRSARNAFLLGADLMFRGELAPAMGWFARGGRALEGCVECAELGWLRTWNAYGQMGRGDPAGAEPAFAEGVEVGQRFGDPDLVTMARLGQGMCRVMQGHSASGVTLLDEVMAGVTSGEVSPIHAGIVYCSVIGACSEIFDLRRAKEWTAALTQWCEAQPELVPFRGNCLVHRCELMQLQGAWGDAVRVAEQACDVLAGAIKWDTLGFAYYQLGELQRLRGEFTKAEESYRTARDAGRAPEPGLALLRFAQGRVDLAAAMIRRAVDETADSAARSRLLPAYVEIMIAAADVSSARAGADELERVATAISAPYLRAMAAWAAGAVLIAEGDPRSALPKLRLAGSAWRELDAPYETARVRVLIGQACRALADRETSVMEFDGARATFERLEARPDLERLDELMAATLARARNGLTQRELEVLSLVASGVTNRVIARQLGLSEKTVARHVSNIFTKIAVTSRSAATAYAYENGLIETS